MSDNRNDCNGRAWCRMFPVPVSSSVPDMDIYCTDDYPREGCKLTIKVRNGRYVMHVAAPNGAPLESYLARNPKAISRMVREWCEGRAPKSHHPSDQEAPGS